MDFLQWSKSLIIAAIIAAISSVSAFHHSVTCQSSPHRICPPIRMTAGADATIATQQRSGKPSASGECYYKRIDGPWKPRKELSSLAIGQRLFATKLLPKTDLLDGKTGPKVFLECGIGRKNEKGKWSIVNGMARIGRRGMKKSVVRKKLMKNFPPDTLIEVYVSKISPEEGRLEVCFSREEALEKGSLEPKIPASSLKAGEELTGTVHSVKPYGLFVDINANRNGLIHISKVAKRQDAYIAKEDGLKSLGLVRGSPVSVIVLSNDRKRLELDFSPDIDEESPVGNDEDGASDELSEEEAAAWAAYAEDDEGSAGNDFKADEEAMWAAYNRPSDDNEEDEDKDIEDALGIGYY